MIFFEIKNVALMCETLQKMQDVSVTMGAGTGGAEGAAAPPVFFCGQL